MGGKEIAVNIQWKEEEHIGEGKDGRKKGTRAGRRWKESGIRQEGSGDMKRRRIRKR